MICKNCQASFEGKYCNNCGQKNYTDKDKKISSIIEEVFHFLTHFEGTFLHTLKVIFFEPGRLSLDYCNGIRKKYFKPISMFFFIVVLYLIFPMFSGLNMPLKYYRDNEFIPAFVTVQLDRKMEQRKITQEELSEKYHKVSEKVAKLLLFIFVPFCAFLLFLFYLRKYKFVFDLVIISTELNVFWIASLYMILPILLIPFYKIPGYTEMTSVYISFSILLIYHMVLLKKVFQQNWLVTFIKAFLFCFLLFAFQLSPYRVILFEISMLFV